MRLMMRRARHTVATTLVLAVAAVAAVPAAIRFTSTFKSLDAGAVNFAGKKVAALVISNDDSLRMAGEESLARELNARGMQAVATYRMAPKEVLNSAETARPWFEKANVEGVVAIRPVSTETQVEYTPSVWSSPNYGTLWGYYGYGWTTVVVLGGGGQRTQRTVVVESTVYSLPRNQLLWAAVTETTNPRDLRAFVAELAKASVEEMQKQGLARRLR
jgi:hypothetical protein